MSKETAAAILTDIYLQTTTGRRRIDSKTVAESYPIPEPTPTMDAAQTEIIRMYDMFLSQISK
jgi:hypothetical protein